MLNVFKIQSVNFEQINKLAVILPQNRRITENKRKFKTIIKYILWVNGQNL
jgi:hypothetical protein